MTRRRSYAPADIRHGRLPNLPRKPFDRVLPPVDVNDNERFPNIASAHQYLADMRVNDPERWARLQADWEGR